MAKVDLSKYGITGTTEVVYNPSYEQLFEEETKPGLEGYEVGKVSELGAVNVMTGIYTGRSPKDKFIVMDENSKNTVWWTSDEYKNDNHPASEEAWAAVKEIAKKELSNKRLYVVDAFCGANKDTRMAVRFIMEVAWQAHFVTNMFIKPTAEELENFEPDFVVYNASKAKVENYKELGIDYAALASQVADKVLEMEKCPYDGQVNLVLTDNEEIKRVNTEFRNIQAPTDVLSFPMIPFETPADYSVVEEDESYFDLDSDELLLGDIMISVPKVFAQAEEYGHSVTREFCFLVAHSMLHLLGYDHMTEDEAKVMEAKQAAALKELGINR